MNRHVRAGDHRRLFAATIALVCGIASLVVSAAPAHASGDEVVIDMMGLHPPVLETHIHDRVVFVNRTGLPVHLQLRPAPDRHEVFEVPWQLSATFYVQGRHPYVVHLQEGAAVRALEGVVEVVGDPEGDRHARVCDGTTLSIQDRPEVCIER